MAIDIMDALVQLLCPTSQSAMSCNQFINTQHHQVLAPMGPLLYFFFFPTVFLIILIYILSSSLLQGSAGRTKGIRLLISIAVYIFIIINGWYAIMLPLSELWFILLPVLGLLYFFLRHFRGERGSGSGGSSSGSLGRIASGDIASSLPVVGSLRKMAVDARTARREIKSAISSAEMAKMLKKSIHEGKSQRPGEDLKEMLNAERFAREVLAKYELNPVREVEGDLDKLRKVLDTLSDIKSDRVNKIIRADIETQKEYRKAA